MAKHTIGEEWRPVPGFESRYEVSNLGRLRGLPIKGRRNQTKIIQEKLRLFRGYVKDILCLGPRFHKPHFRHTLVLMAFVGPRPSGMECNHKNGIKHDNRLENLEWVTPQYNAMHRLYVLGIGPGYPQGTACPGAKLNADAVKKIVQQRKSGRSYSSLGREYGVKPNTIKSVCLGISWSRETGLPQQQCPTRLKQRKEARRKALEYLKNNKPGEELVVRKRRGV